MSRVERQAAIVRITEEIGAKGLELDALREAGHVEDLRDARFLGSRRKN